MEIKWTKSCLNDILNEKEFLKVKSILHRNLDNIHIRTKQVEAIGNKIRRLRIGNNRLFLLIQRDIVFCVAYLGRKDAYKKITINKLRLLITKLMEEGL